MSNSDKQKILRYAELILKRDRQRRLERGILPEERVELERIRVELGMSHEEIIDKAVKRLIDESE